MDCIVLVGNRDSYRQVSLEQNKAFLKVGSRTILEIILAELQRVDEIERILMVGPTDRLEKLLAEKVRNNYSKPLLVFEQKKDLLENALAAIDATADSQPHDRYVLILPSDIPLVTAPEVRQFIQRCDMSSHDYIVGLTTSEALSRFYPSGDEPGVVMSYFHLSAGKFRVNNIHMVRPSAFRNLEYIRRTYAMRYQKEFSNIVRMIWQLTVMIFKAPAAIFFYLGMHTANMFRACKLFRLARFMEKGLKMETVEKSITYILGTRFHLVITDFGGSAIDVDNEKDYQTVCRRYEEWVRMQKALVDAPEKTADPVN